MATSQQELSDFIKNIHINLRLKSRQIGADAAWTEHCKNGETLKKYATAMQELATLHWERNNTQDPSLNRIYWVVERCEEYFFGEGSELAAKEERKLQEKYFGKSNAVVKWKQLKVAKLLDVGSCYNPFKSFPIFDVTAIDIAPASEDVLLCDFLNVDIERCSFLVSNSFDVIVFSLFLEYLPDPKQRYICCKKAYDLLTEGGILIVLTPDSKHATANSQLMKLWRRVFAQLGFLRVNYEKLKHLHCMIFMKCYNPSVPKQWLFIQECQLPIEESLPIPQDDNPYEDRNEKIESNNEDERSEFDNNQMAERFSLLPGEQIYL